VHPQRSVLYSTAHENDLQGLSTAERVAISLGKAGGVLSRMFRLGAGETVPGAIVQRLAPSAGRSLAGGLRRGTVVVSGTNGKTTTTSMLTTIAEGQGITCVSNRTGSNMQAGIVGSLMRSPGAELGIFEVDEAALPTLVPVLRPHTLVLTNIFRDQLDRFGEPERVSRLFADAITLLNGGSILVVNADDPFLYGWGPSRPTRYFGVRSDFTDAGRGGSGDPELCPACGAALFAESRTFAHLGAFRCRACAWRSPVANTVARVIDRGGLSALRIEVDGAECTLNVGGLYNAYNAIAALAAGDALGFDRRAAMDSLSQFRPRFGRLEEVMFEDVPISIVLAKNPAGANAIIEEIGSSDVGAIVLAVNDRAADGRDVSWIWDIDVERLSGLGVPVVASGLRAQEVALRLAYASVASIAIEAEPVSAIRMALTLGARRRIVVLATYTAMLELRAALLGRRKSVIDLSRG